MRKRFAIFFIIALLGSLDAALKVWALSSAPTAPANPIASFALHKNPGIAFDIPIPLEIVLALTVVAIIGVAKMMHMNRATPVFVGGSLVIVGAVGNAVDRAVHGFTTDYLMLFERSVINIADVLILTGAAVLLWYYRDTPARRNKD